MEYNLKGAEAAQTHEKLSLSKSKSNHIVYSHPLSLSSMS